jgi:dolichyl-phosphate-mannose--protein O-mannosyl transferase
MYVYIYIIKLFIGVSQCEGQLLQCRKSKKDAEMGVKDGSNRLKTLDTEVGYIYVYIYICICIYIFMYIYNGG